MSEVERAAVMQAVVKKRLKQAAAERLGLCVRQVKRLARRYREQGAAGMASRSRMIFLFRDEPVAFRKASDLDICLSHRIPSPL